MIEKTIDNRKKPIKHTDKRGYQMINLYEIKKKKLFKLCEKRKNLATILFQLLFCQQHLKEI